LRNLAFRPLLRRLGVMKFRCPESLYEMGVPDPLRVLKEGEIFFRDARGECWTGDVLVTRSPCMYPGDVRKLKAVVYPELMGLSGQSGCYVGRLLFSVHGKRAEADKMAGGDYDGDQFFVCRYRPLVDSIQTMCQPLGREEEADTKENEIGATQMKLRDGNNLIDTVGSVASMFRNMLLSTKPAVSSGKKLKESNEEIAEDVENPEIMHSKRMVAHIQTTLDARCIYTKSSNLAEAIADEFLTLRHTERSELESDSWEVASKFFSPAMEKLRVKLKEATNVYYSGIDAKKHAADLSGLYRRYKNLNESILTRPEYMEKQEKKKCKDKESRESHSVVGKCFTRTNQFESELYPAPEINCVKSSENVALDPHLSLSDFLRHCDYEIADEKILQAKRGAENIFRVYRDRIFKDVYNIIREKHLPSGMAEDIFKEREITRIQSDLRETHFIPRKTTRRLGCSRFSEEQELLAMALYEHVYTTAQKQQGEVALSEEEETAKEPQLHCAWMLAGDVLNSLKRYQRDSKYC
jgi:hypothetical protein